MDRTRSISSASAVSLRRASHENETVIDRFYRILDDSFEISARGTSISLEVFCGYIQFISSMYVLPVVPAQLKAAGYIRTPTIEATALSCAFGCLLSSYITNLPFAIAPPTSVSIYLAVALQQGGLQRYHGDTAVILSGFALVIIGVIKPITTFVSRLIPDCIQASTAVGIGLITAFAGLIELELVVPGRFTILELGSITPSIIIAICSSALIATAMHFHVKGSFVSGLVFGTFVWWLYSNSWPEKIWQMPDFDFDIDVSVDLSVLALLCNLVFLYILALNGIARSMSDLASLTNDDGSIPRGNWLYIVCGLSTIVSGYFSGPPILISPESAGGIKAGAKTGLSTLVCGLLYVVSIFFCPMFAEVPPSGTSPLLILVGMLLFMNVGRINWNAPGDAVPAFFNILLIPFSYSIMCGVGFGYLLYFMIGLSTGVHVESAASMMNKLDYTWRERQPSDGPLPYVNNYSGKVSRSNSEDKKIIEIADEPKLRIEDITDFSYQESGKSSELDRDFGKGKSPSTRYSLRSNESAVDDGDTTASQRITRNRNGSVVDQLPMDLDSGIQSLNF